MVRFIVIMLTIIAVLSAANLVYRLTPIEYSQQDNDFAHEYAASMLETVAITAKQGIELESISSVKACNFYLDGEDEFYRFKHAAIHYKGELAEDFVYAFDLAESWCRYAAEAAEHPDNLEAKTLAKQKFKAAHKELTAITYKKYQAKQK